MWLWNENHCFVTAVNIDNGLINVHGSNKTFLNFPRALFADTSEVPNIMTQFTYLWIVFLLSIIS